MVYRIEFRPAAFADLASLDRTAREKIVVKIDGLTKEPRPQGVEQLKGGNKRYRIRVGAHRVVYDIEDDVLLVLVVRIGHRREVYRFLG
jgi:mRNA interferase RelE/StbE